MEVYRKCVDAHLDTGGYDSNYITKLVNNYRSHPAILATPNDLFYDNEMECCADPVRSHCLSDWEHLITGSDDFPIIFHGVDGINQQEGNSPSWFNIAEAEVVKDYVSKLCTDTRRNRVDPKDIAIITPYSKQSKKLRLLMNSFHYDAVSVGSVEQFQGQERKVIIVSTVRTNKSLLDFDIRHNLGNCSMCVCVYYTKAFLLALVIVYFLLFMFCVCLCLYFF